MKNSSKTPADNVRPMVFIGLDGAEPNLIRKWMDDGVLPNLAKIYHAGLSSDVATLPGFGDGAVWPTLITGVNPGRHGRYFRRQFKPRSYKGRLFSIETDMKYEPFWSTLSRADKQVAILDIPYMNIVNDNNSIQLANWLIHDRYADPISTPASFAQETIREFGDDPVEGNSDSKGRDASSLKKLTCDLLYRIDMKERMVIETMRNKRRDLLMTCFTEPHDIGHMCWHYHDSNVPGYDADWVAMHGDPVRQIYMRIDEAIGNISSYSGEDTIMIIFAGLGMGPAYTANGVLDRILARIDGYDLPPDGKLCQRVLATGRSRITTKIARMLDNYSRRYATGKRQFFATEHNENSGAIRINLEGRESSGKVPADEFDSVCKTLIEDLMRIRNAQSGEALVDKVIKVRDVYHGERLGWLPDLMVCWNRNAPITSITSPEIGKIDGIRSWGRTGDHTYNAMIMLSGDGVKPGQLKEPPSIVDISATIASVHGVELTDVDGRAFRVI